MTTIAANAPLITAKAQAPKPATPAPATTTTDATKLGSASTYTPSLNNTIDVVGTAVNVANGARFAFTPPVIFDIVKSSIKSGISVSNIAWFVIPSAIRNVRDVFSHKISAGRAGANVATEATIGIGKGIVSGVVVQSLSIATGPIMGLLPISPAILPFVGIGVALAGMVGTYWVLNKVVKKTGIDQKMSDGLTKVFGGDLQTPAPAATPAKA